MREEGQVSAGFVSSFSFFFLYTFCAMFEEFTCPAFATGDGPRHVRSGAPCQAHFVHGAGVAGAHFHASTCEYVQVSRNVPFGAGTSMYFVLSFTSM